MTIRITVPDCSCVSGQGCDGEGSPGCSYCRDLDPYWGCPVDVDAEDEDEE